MENGLSNSSKRSLKISLRSPKRNLKKKTGYRSAKALLKTYSSATCTVTLTHDKCVLAALHLQ